jgi:hypothetical protein
MNAGKVREGFRVVSEREEEEVDLSLILPEPNVSLNYCIEHYSAQ